MSNQKISKPRENYLPPLIDVNISRTHVNATIPEYKTALASGCDLHALHESIIPSRYTQVVSTGLKLEFPAMLEAQIRSRSGLAVKGIFVANSPGTIDADFRGEIKVILYNMSAGDFTIKKGDRIAQLVFAPVARVKFSEIDESQLSQTERGKSGFGSTGV
jgi:dUTP pyrophosphatase